MKKAWTVINSFATKLSGAVVLGCSNKQNVSKDLNYLFLSATVYLELCQHFIQGIFILS